jgi:adenylate kinase family enzyme
MRKVAVFGNAGGGKSALSRRLAEITGLPLYTLDIIQFRGGRYRPEEKDGGKIPDDEYLTIHHDILPAISGLLTVTAVCRRLGSGSL